MSEIAGPAAAAASRRSASDDTIRASSVPAAARAVSVGYGRRVAGFAPAIVTVIACTWMLVANDTPLSAVALFALYWLMVATVPGTLLWRMLRARSVSFVEDAAVGTVLGLAVHVLLLFVLNRVGSALGIPGVLPYLAPVWIVATVGASVVRPAWRRAWRTAAAPVTGWMAWGTSAVATLTVWWTTNTGLSAVPVRPVPLSGAGWYSPSSAFFSASVDQLFFQALAASARRGGTVYPNVSSVPLRYTTMVHEHMADANRWTGIDLTLVTMRLHTPVLLVLAVALCAVLAHRLTGSGHAGALGAVLAWLTGPAALWSGVINPLMSVQSLNAGNWVSSVQTFGQPIFYGLLVIVAVVLTERRVNRRLWVALAPVILVCAAARPPFIMMLWCGLAVALVVGWLNRSRLTGRKLVLMAMSVGAYGLGAAFVFGTDTRGATLGDATQLIRRMPVAVALGPLENPVSRVWVIGIVVVIWLLGVIGVVAALVLRRREPVVWLLAAVGVAGFGAAILGQHAGISQIHFIRGGWPVLGVVAALGFAKLTDAAGARARSWSLTIAALALGLATALVVRTQFELPREFEGRLATNARLLAPFALVLVVAAVVGTAVLVWGAWSRRRDASHTRTPSRRTSLTLGLLAALGVVQGTALADVATFGTVPIPREPFTTAPEWGTPEDGAVVARWLRANSDTHDLVSTNMHEICRGPDLSICSPQHFWLTALSERDVLLEGWAYSTPSSTAAPDWDGNAGPFWDPEFLAANDAVFTDPSADGVAWMRRQGVRWMVVDRELAPRSTALADYAEPAFQRGSLAVYEVTLPAGETNDGA